MKKVLIVFIALMAGRGMQAMDDPRLTNLTERLIYGDMYADREVTAVPCKDASRSGAEGRIIHAVKMRNFELVQELLNAGTSANTRNEDGDTLLHLAAYEGHEEMCRLLLEHNAQIDAKNALGSTPLMVAVARNDRQAHINVCRLLIAKGADINARNYLGKIPLIYAAGMGHKEICKLLLEHNARVNVKDNEGQTPLVGAALSGNKKICKLLIDAVIKQTILPGATGAFLGIRKFRNSTDLDPIDREIVKQIARQAYAAPKIKNLFDQIGAIPYSRMRNALHAYATQQLKLKMD